MCDCESYHRKHITNANHHKMLCGITENMKLQYLIKKKKKQIVIGHNNKKEIIVGCKNININAQCNTINRK